MEYFIIANWKSNLALSEVEEWLDDFEELYEKTGDVTVGIAPAFTEIVSVSDGLNQLEMYDIILMAQDIGEFDKGKHTGSVSGYHLDDIGVEAVIIGHSEHRKEFNESDELINQKIAQALKYKIKPVVAVSNIKQVESIAKGKFNNSELVIAYEPLESIGGGNPAEEDEVLSFMAQVKKVLGDNVATIYGGSVDSKDVERYLDHAEIEGFLVGTASLDPEEFVGIINRVSG
ncbi:triosephosphate isomerase [candidate division WWE3 bacterium]|uniref:Triosephosphate isomerase n=1 Tax=candidate division WWE3 bacterium TaxID=2053526 RepID=A0A955LJP4_UNCKA|nr:triosephosphate isomerase [candidate division WWE3 bacterium]